MLMKDIAQRLSSSKTRIKTSGVNALSDFTLSETKFQ